MSESIQQNSLLRANNNFKLFSAESRLVWGGIFTFWTIVICVSKIQVSILAELYPQRYFYFNLRDEIIASAIAYYGWAILTPLIFWYLRKFNFEKAKSVTSYILIHILLAVGTTCFYFFITSFKVFLYPQKYTSTGFFEHMTYRMYHLTHFHLIIYGAILGLGFALNYYSKYREREQTARMLQEKSLELESDLAQSVSKYKSLIKDKNEKENDEPLYRSRLPIKSAGKILLIDVDEIDWIGAEGAYVNIYAEDKSNLMRGSLTNLEEKLDPKKFLRIHRSTIVNLASVKEIHSMFRGEYVLILENGTKLKLSRSYRKKAKLLFEGL